MRSRKVRGSGDENEQGDVRMKKLVWSGFFSNFGSMAPSSENDWPEPTYLKKHDTHCLPRKIVMFVLLS